MGKQFCDMSTLEIAKELHDMIWEDAKINVPSKNHLVEPDKYLAHSHILQYRLEGLEDVSDVEGINKVLKKKFLVMLKRECPFLTRPIVEFVSYDDGVTKGTKVLCCGYIHGKKYGCGVLIQNKLIEEGKSDIINDTLLEVSNSFKKVVTKDNWICLTCSEFIQLAGIIDSKDLNVTFDEMIGKYRSIKICKCKDFDKELDRVIEKRKKMLRRLG